MQPTTKLNIENAIADLYVNRRNQYLKQVKGGTYLTLKKGVQTATNGKKYTVRPLVDSMFTEHLAGKATYGVFATDKTKFMVFDFDFDKEWNECKRYFYLVRETVISAGIPANNIYATFSGNKGLHLEIFFTEEVPVKQCQDFYSYVLQEAGITALKSKIEYRPTNTQGVKLPLGVHHATNKRCSFVDPLNVESTLPQETVLTVQKVNAVHFLNNVMETIYDEGYLTDDEVLVQATQTLLPHVKGLDIYKIGVDEQYTAEHYHNLYENGLTVKGSRDNITFQLAKFFKSYYGMGKAQVTEILTEWILKQPQNMYDTPREQVVAKTVEKVEKVFYYDYALNFEERELNFSVDELRTILTAKNSKGKAFTTKQKAVLFALLGHAKRYATKKGTFYMTHAQITATGGLKNRSEIKKLIEEFALVGLVTIHRSNERAEGTYKHLPNVYEVLFAEAKAVDNKNTATNSQEVAPSEATNNGTTPITVENYNADTFTNVVNTVFTPKELRKLLPRRQAQSFIA